MVWTRIVESMEKRRLALSVLLETIDREIGIIVHPCRFGWDRQRCRDECRIFGVVRVQSVRQFDRAGIDADRFVVFSQRIVEDVRVASSVVIEPEVFWPLLARGATFRRSWSRSRCCLLITD